MNIGEEIRKIERAYRAQMTNYNDANNSIIEIAWDGISRKLRGKTVLEIEKIINSSTVSSASERIACERIYRRIGKSNIMKESLIVH